MISIIICSRHVKLNQELLENIKETIGYDYELIVIDNSENKFSIFEAYNLGIGKSKGDYLFFIHDDVYFHTLDWGRIIVAVFSKNSNIGLIGLAGSKVKTKMPSSWWSCLEQHRITNILQHHKNKDKEIHNFGFENQNNVEVAVIDGVFMAMRKENRIHFAKHLKGFHAYDLNLSLEIKKYGYDIIVTNEILLEHFSHGFIDKNWIKSSFAIHKMYRKELPICVDGTTVSIRDEISNAEQFINLSLRFGLKRIAIIVWFELFLLHPKSYYHFRFWKNLFKIG